MMEQIIPREFCLECKGCCRFKEPDSAWTPCLLDEEIQSLLDIKIPPACIGANKKLLAIPGPDGEGFICPFLDVKENKCKIYDLRPFECRLYPFLINFRKGKVILTLDLNCRYVARNLRTEAFKKYTENLINFLNSPAQIRLLKENPQIIQAYEDVLDIIELEPRDEA